MIRQKLIILCFAAAFAPSTASAFTVTQEDQDACTPDVFRLCGDFIPDQGPIVQCLQSKRPELSAGCERVIFPPTLQPTKPVVPALSAKIRQLRKKRLIKKHPQ